MHRKLLRNVKVKENHLNADSRRCSAMGFAQADPPLAGFACIRVKKYSIIFAEINSVHKTALKSRP
jgi:hypothetical protein